MLAQAQSGSLHLEGSQEYPAASGLELGPEREPSWANTQRGASRMDAPNANEYILEGIVGEGVEGPENVLLIVLLHNKYVKQGFCFLQESRIVVAKLIELHKSYLSAWAKTPGRRGLNMVRRRHVCHILQLNVIFSSTTVL